MWMKRYGGGGEVSRVSDVGSIPIARSITHDDSIGLTHLNYLNLAKKWPFLDLKWTTAEAIGPWCFAERTGKSGGPTNLARLSRLR